SAQVPPPHLCLTTLGLWLARSPSRCLQTLVDVADSRRQPETWCGLKTISSTDRGVDVSRSAVTQIRLAEVLSALSLTTDLGAGMPFEKGLRTCVVASSLASALRLSVDMRRAVFHAALLRSVGCTAHAPENAEMFGDDLQFERAFKELDPADMATF